MKMPDAQAAVGKELERLQERPAWTQEKEKSRAAVIQDARNERK